MDVAGFPIIDLPPEVNTPEKAVEFLVVEMVHIGSLSPEVVEKVIRCVWQRERLGSTAIGRGVAIPHAKMAAAGMVGLIGRCGRPFDWPGAIDGNAVEVVCVLVIQESSTGDYLRTLERVVRSLRS